MLKGKFKAFRDLASSRTSSESAWESSLSDEENDDLRHFKENFATSLIAHKYLNAWIFLQERLASTMLLRRKHFLYLRWSHSRQEVKSLKATPSASEKLTAPSNAVAGPKAILNHNIAATLTPLPLSGTTPSRLSGTWAYVPPSDVTPSEAAMNRQIVNTFPRGPTPSTAENEKLEYPQRPKKTELNCPYCYRPIHRGDKWTDEKWL
jgi:hypothetical protein